MHRLTALVVLLTACADAPPPQPAADSPAGQLATMPAPDSSRGVCPATGLWAQCSLVDRIERSGLVPRVDSSSQPDEPPVSVRGFLMRIGSSELEVYLYPSTVAREADAAKLDTARYLAYDAPVPMQPRPTLLQSANLLAIFHSRNDHQRERVGDAITAGPPQPARP